MVYFHKEVSITWEMVYFSNDILVKVGDGWERIYFYHEVWKLLILKEKLTKRSAEERRQLNDSANRRLEKYQVW